MRKIEERPWWPQLLELKDTLSLRELGSRYGVAPAAISNALKRSGLSREAAPPGPRDRRPAERKAAAAEAMAAPAPTVQAPKAKAPKAKAEPPAKAAEPGLLPAVKVVPLADLVAALALELVSLKGEVASLKTDLIDIRAAAPGVSRLQLELGPWELDGKGLGWARPILPLAYAGALASEDGYRVFCGAGGEIRGEVHGLEAAKAAADAVAVGMGYVLDGEQ